MDNEKSAGTVIELWTPIQHDAYRIVNSILHDPQLTEDVLQDALVIAFRKFNTLRDQTKFASWYIKIAVRLSYRSLKIYKRHVLVDEFHDSVINKQSCNYFVDETLLYTESQNEVMRIIKMLPQDQRHLFYLRYVNDLKLTEIAALTEINLSTLKSIFHRAHKKLYEQLSEEIKNE